MILPYNLGKRFRAQQIGQRPRNIAFYFFILRDVERPFTVVLHPDYQVQDLLTALYLDLPCPRLLLQRFFQLSYRRDVYSVD